MSDLSTEITASFCPPLDEILRRDAAYHLGERDRYEYGVVDAVRGGIDGMSAQFLCLNLGAPEILAPRDYAKLYTLHDGELFCPDARDIQQISRTLATVNRHTKFLRDDLCYSYDLYDARRTDYAAAFGTNLPVPVMQYHRWRGLAAVITPIARDHVYPPWNIPYVNDTTKFSEKRPIAFWRGVLSGFVETDSGREWINWVFRNKSITEQERYQFLRQSGRFSVCWDHVENPAVDAKLIFDGSSPIAEKSPLLGRLSAPPASRDEHMAHKYLLALDGFDGPSNIYWMLNTNSLVLRQESDWEIFGGCYFSPWVHYVPIAQDCGDLNEKIEWCESHPSECERMIENAHIAWMLLFDRSFAELREKYNFEILATWMKD